MRLGGVRERIRLVRRLANGFDVSFSLVVLGQFEIEMRRGGIPSQSAIDPFDGLVEPARLVKADRCAVVETAVRGRRNTDLGLDSRFVEVQKHLLEAGELKIAALGVIGAPARFLQLQELLRLGQYRIACPVDVSVPQQRVGLVEQFVPLGLVFRDLPLKLLMEVVRCDVVCHAAALAEYLLAELVVLVLLGNLHEIRHVRLGITSHAVFYAPHNRVERLAAHNVSDPLKNGQFKFRRSDCAHWLITHMLMHTFYD